jgi:hypothetical protein
LAGCLTERSRSIGATSGRRQARGPKRYANGLYDLLRCSAEVCDANNYKVERQADSTVLLRMTGGLYIGGGTYGDNATRHLPDGHVYRFVASPMGSRR